MLTAAALPFAPVLGERATVSWPAPGEQPVSTTAFFVAYRPATLAVAVPCEVLRAGPARSPATVLATGPDGIGIAVCAVDVAARIELAGRIVAAGRARVPRVGSR